MRKDVKKGHKLGKKVFYGSIKWQNNKNKIFQTKYQ